MTRPTMPDWDDRERDEFPRLSASCPSYGAQSLRLCPDGGIVCDVIGCEDPDRAQRVLDQSSPSPTAGEPDAREVEITRDDDVMVFGGGFGDGSEVVGTIDPAALDGDMVLVHLTEANPAEGEAPERLSVLIPKEALCRIVATIAPQTGADDT